MIDGQPDIGRSSQPYVDRYDASKRIAAGHGYASGAHRHVNHWVLLAAAWNVFCRILDSLCRLKDARLALACHPPSFHRTKLKTSPGSRTRAWVPGAFSRAAARNRSGVPS